MKAFLIAVLTAALMMAEDQPTGPRTTPPNISTVSPLGIARGMTVELTVEGLNLAKAQSIHFDQPGIRGKVVRVKELPDLADIRLGANGTPSTIDLGPLPPRNQVTVEIDVDAEAPVGPVGFRIATPLGTSPQGRFLIEPYYGESPDREPNNDPDTAFEAYLPTILVGEISRPGDLDFFKIRVKAGQQLVFENSSVQTGSSLQPLVTILKEDHTVVREYGSDGGDSAANFTHKFEQAGTYYVRVSDYQDSGRTGHTYRIKTGSFALATGAFPLGVPQGKTVSVDLLGYGFKEAAVIEGKLAPGEIDTMRYRPAGSFSELKLAVGTDPELRAAGNNTSLASAQPIATPVTLNGKLSKAGEEHFYKFSGRKGQKLVADVAARRFDSKLDSYLEILDAKGKPIEIAVARAVTENFIALRDHDSSSRGIRLSAWSGINVGDYLMSGGELMRLEALPRGPDDDAAFESFNNQRLSYLGTSGEAHHIDRAIYKVQLHPAGTQFNPNGLPVIRLYARNDDGGPNYGKDSKLDFTVPADGDYYVRLRDVRSQGGEEYSYRLNVRPPRPDFRLAVTPRNPNVPQNGAIPITVTAMRIDGFDGAIEVKLDGLPTGVSADPGVIQAGQVSTTLTIASSARTAPFTPVPLTVVGQAKIGNVLVARQANPEDKLKLLALVQAPDIRMTAVTKEVVLEPGGTAEIVVEIERLNGFAGRVPVEVRN
ncbi:MAG: PPC domain-containing protein, partial [Bryobacteraceae bacterium]